MWQTVGVRAAADLSVGYILGRAASAGRVADGSLSAVIVVVTDPPPVQCRCAAHPSVFCCNLMS